MLCEDLVHATEQLNMLTEASKKHSALLQAAQEELTRKEARIQELQHEVRCLQGPAPLHMGPGQRLPVVEVPALANRALGWLAAALWVQTCWAVFLPVLNP